MAQGEVVSVNENPWPLTNPWPLLAGGLAALVVAWGMCVLTPHFAVPLRIVLILAGLVAVGGGISLRIQYAGKESHDSFYSAGVVALGSVAALLALVSLNDSWDTAQLLMKVLAGVALGSALLVLMPRLARRIILSLLILYHFGGILMAVLSVPAQGRPPPWLVIQIYTRFYRPYLQFMYLNNAYHFYSPEPGPATLLWFRIEYTNGDSQWLEIPKREDHETRLEYQRRLALTESINLPAQPPPMLGQLQENRFIAGNNHKPPIPMYPPDLMPIPFQYKEPPYFNKKLLASYVRQVAQSHARPDTDIKNIKAYRVIHNIMDPKPLADGVSPLHPTSYLPYYQGTFDKEGRLVFRKTDGTYEIMKPTLEEIDQMSLRDRERTNNFIVPEEYSKQDPFIYWLIPILPVESGVKDPADKRPKNVQDYGVIDYLKIHAGDGKKAADK